jgi:hypothetical protein
MPANFGKLFLALANPPAAVLKWGGVESAKPDIGSIDEGAGDLENVAKFGTGGYPMPAEEMGNEKAGRSRW